MKKCFLIGWLLLITILLFAQDETADSIAILINKHPQQDSIRVILLNRLTHQFLQSGSDKTIETGNAALQLSKKIKYVPGEIMALERMEKYYQACGDYSKALKIFDQEQHAYQKNSFWMMSGFEKISHAIVQQKNHRETERKT